jgi:hypothetical protein
MRPWLDWRTVSTASYRFHFRPEFEPWTRDLAQRVESIDSALAAFIGYTAPKPVDVVVDDPYSIANGYAIPYVSKPATVWWTTPPDPRDDVGNFRTFGELLAVHELAHLAHMTRPSRNRLRRLRDRLFVNLGPVTTKSPRWVYEGYATLVEGRLTGTGRPNNAHRPGLLRQWALEGRLPTYAQLNGTGDFHSGSFPYLGGSAFLEWLAARHGDSSLVHVWRRLTARRSRSFVAAFSGVFGEPPAVLYGRHVAELTANAVAVRSALETAGLREGTLIQRRTWSTGDPAIAPNGERVAITLADRGRPGRVVVWKTAPPPPDTTQARRRRAALRRDPEDVPDRQVYPPPLRAERTLAAWNGRAYLMPRWFADNRNVLLTRWTVRDDGSQSPALYAWDTERGTVRAVTEPVGVSQGDPHPNGKEAVAMQCRWGHCDMAHVDLDRGTMVTLLEGNHTTTYHRPRYSADGRRIAVGVSQGGRWRVLVTDQRGRNPRFVDPDDGANRYEPEWVGDSLVVVSERGGIPNLELIDLTANAVRSLTRVTGAAYAPAVNTRDGSIWFLGLHARGLDVRRLDRRDAIADSIVPIAAERFGFAAPQGVRPGTAFGVSEVAAAESYGMGPRRSRLVPGGFGSADGLGVTLSVFSADVVGRLNATATGAYGVPGTWLGGAVRATWRRPRPALEFGALAFMQEPSRGADAQPGVDTLDASLFQGILALAGERRGEGWQLRARLGGGAGRLSPRHGGTHLRSLGFGETALSLSHSRGARTVGARLRVHVSAGSTEQAFQRSVASIELRGARVGLPLPLQLGATAGRITGTPHPYERFVIGGASPPVGDSSLMSQRFDLPVYPTGIATGNAVFGWRAAIPSSLVTAFYEGASASDDVRHFTKWNRVAGLERNFSIGPLPAILVPRTVIRGGAGYTLDAPFRKRVRAFLVLRVEP